MKVSVIIPLFNLGVYLDDAVSSVKAQTYSEWEVIIVDDGSTETVTKDILERIKIDNPGFKIYTKKNSGLAETRNYGIKRASGEYIVCLDADDMLAPDYLESAAAILEADKTKKLGFVTTWLQEFGIRDNLWETSSFNVAELLLNNVIHAGSMFRKEAWQKVGGYRKMDIGGYEDWDFWLSIVEKGYRWQVIKEPLFWYRIREDSMLASAKTTHTDIYLELFSDHKKLFLDNFENLIVENAKEVKELHDIIRQKNEVLAELEEDRREVIVLREQNFRLRDEINTMRNSRVLGRIIKAREFVGDTRKVVSPRVIVHKIRVIGAPLVPGPMRRYIKRRARNLLQPPTKIRVIENKKWGGSTLVSVIIPYYNRADTIDETLESLAEQTFTDFETILIDDGSTDKDSIDKFDELKASDLKITLLKQRNQGVAATRNNGIEAASGKYIICLDSDDGLEPTFIEKCTALLETDPDISLATTYMHSFGVVSETYEHIPYNPLTILNNNMVITAAEFKKSAWKAVGGYKPGIGYEDWDFWVSLSERGFWGKVIPEELFKYRTAMQSRYVDDKESHWKNINKIKSLHPNYRKNIKKLIADRRTFKHIIEPKSAFLNMSSRKNYRRISNNKPNILIILPWMTFGGAESVILEFCGLIKNDFNLSFVTGLESENEWEDRFRQITDQIYHLPHLFDQPELYLEFISNYIKTRQVEGLHIIHTDYAFTMLPELKKRHPNIKIAVTLFNDRAAHFDESMKVKDYIDIFTTDNNTVHEHYQKVVPAGKDLRVIPNAVNSVEVYNPALFDRQKERESLGLAEDDIGVFFIGRVSEEKNPDVFLEVARRVISKNQKIHFFVIGSGPLTPMVEKRINEINNSHVQYLGYQPVVTNYLSAADIFVLPSSIEGFPPSIVQAMSMKVAPIASDVGAVSDIISSGKDGFVVTPAAVDEIEKTILKLEADRNMLDSIKHKGRETVEKKYSSNILGRNYRKLYKDLSK